MARKQPVIWALLRAWVGLCRILPHRWALLLGDAIGRTVHWFSRRHVHKAEARCERILGVPPLEASNIVRKSYLHFGRAGAEFARSGRIKPHLQEIITLHGRQYLEEAYREGKGVILLSAHIGNWEYAGALIAHLGYPVNAIGADQRDARITELIAGLRQSSGVTPLGKGMDLKGAIRCLQRGELLAVLLDQDARDKGVVAPFLGYPASTPVGPLKLAHKLGAKILPGHMVRRQDGIHYDLYFEPALQGRDGKPFGEDILDAAVQCNDIISKWVRDTPEQWLWMYPRWASTLGDR